MRVRHFRVRASPVARCHRPAAAGLDAAEAFSLSPGPAGAKKDRCIRLARALLDFEGVTLGEERFHRLRPVVERLFTQMGAANTQGVVNLVAPFCWVDPKAAANLLAVA